MPDSIRSDITIIGAGPAGTTAAIALAKKGIPSLLIDKQEFPRRKICGDGLSGNVLSNLNKLDPAYITDLKESGLATASMAARFHSPGLKMTELSFQSGDLAIPPGFICKRFDFDHFLLKKTAEFKEIHVISGKQVASMARENGGILLNDKHGRKIVHTRLLLFAAGSNRRLIRQLDPEYPGSTEEGVGVRGYFENVTGSDAKHAIEIHFLKELLPWYLWIFPFSDGSANVGLALPEPLARKNPLSMKELLFHLIQSYPHLKSRFANSSLNGIIEADRLAYYTGPCKVSGDQYLLLGDAARLIDPFTGEGIGNAMSSGRFAAEVAADCFVKNDFSQVCTAKYQEMIDDKLLPELALSLRLQKLARYKNLLNLVIGRASRHEKTRLLLSEMLYNPDIKLKLSKPEFYIKMLLGL
jgi:menaquinone-9 beta-reductase